MLSAYQCREAAKRSLGWLLANGQTIRWATEKVAIRDILLTDEFRLFFEKAKGGRSADIGCGGGRYILDFLAPRCLSVIGVEYCEPHVQLARTRVFQNGLANRVSVVQGSADHIPVVDSSIDFVLCTQVLEHLAEPRNGVREIRRILRSGGRGIISIPIPPDPVPNPEHLHTHFFPSHLDEMIGRAGLKVLRREYSMYAVGRAVAWLVDTTHLPLPIIPLCRLEQATSKFVPWPRPHVYICVVEKNAEA